MDWYKDFFVNPRFFFLWLCVIGLLAVSILSPLLETIAMISAGALFLLCCWDIYVLYRSRSGIKAQRHLPEKLSLADSNPYSIEIQSAYPVRLHIDIHDELPIQLQARDFVVRHALEPGQSKTVSLSITPLKRGEYHFGTLNIVVQTSLQLFGRRYRAQEGQMVKVYPSFLSLRQYRIAAISNRLQDLGIKKIRRIGDTMEFEHIKDYVIGDDPRKINWKATARRTKLMTNVYQEERSQHIYCFIDKGRPMRMPFEGLTLLDHCINASLVLLQVAIAREDKAGLITFSNKISSILPASKQSYQMNRILESLYNQRTLYKESNYELLYQVVKQKIKQRSLIFLFTHFDSLPAVERQLRYLKALNRQHLVVPIFFANSELKAFAKKEPQHLEEIYHQAAAESLLSTHYRILAKLKTHGIRAISTTPERLTINAINKYIEIKAEGRL